MPDTLRPFFFSSQRKCGVQGSPGRPPDSVTHLKPQSFPLPQGKLLSWGPALGLAEPLDFLCGLGLVPSIPPLTP